MLVDIPSLVAHREAIQRDDEGWFIWGSVHELWAQCHILRAQGAPTEVDAFASQWRAVLNRLWDLQTIAAKLAWMLGQQQAGSLSREAWMHFATNDIVSFLTTTRSLFDHFGRGLRAAAPQPGGVPAFSFNALKSWLERDPNRSVQVGEEVGQLILACDWFDELREVRDELIHREGQVIVFPDDEPTVVFQVHDRSLERLVNEPGLLVGKNVASFERFAAAVTSRLHILLEECSGHLYRAFDLSSDGKPGWSRHPGLEVLANWTDEFLGALGP